jgi:hypothetical protein
MNREQTAAVLAILRTVWQNEEITTERITAYHWAFDHMDYQVVEDACKRWIKTNRFFPKPAELLELIAEQTVAPNIVPETAWAEVMQEIGRVGVAGIPSFSHPLIAEAVEAVGWYEIGMAEYKAHPTLRAQFRDALKAVRARAIHDAQLGPIPDSLTAISSGSDKALASGGIS